MKRLDVLHRDKARELYATVPLLDMIDRQARKYALPPYGLQLRPEEIFQMVVAWLDRVRTESDDEAAVELMQEAWDRQWLVLRDMEERLGHKCWDGELEELTCVILCWVYECFVVLSREIVHGDLWYQMMAEKLQLQMMRHMDVWTEVIGEISAECGEPQNWELLQEWLVGYVERCDAPVTTVQGDLILQEGGMFLPLPSGEHDTKMYSKEAQKIWRMLVEKKWCEKQGSMLVWKKSNLSFGYLVKIVADKLQVYDPLREGTIAWSSFKEIFKDSDGSLFGQGRNGASKIGKKIPVKNWPIDARELMTWMKTL